MTLSLPFSISVTGSSQLRLIDTVTDPVDSGAKVGHGISGLSYREGVESHNSRSTDPRAELPTFGRSIHSMVAAQEHGLTGPHLFLS